MKKILEEMVTFIGSLEIEKNSQAEEERREKRKVIFVWMNSLFDGGMNGTGLSVLRNYY